MRATQIANGKEAVHVRPSHPAGYKTPKKSVKLAKLRTRRGYPLEEIKAEVREKVQPVRTLREADESNERRRQRTAGMRNR